MKKIVWLIFLLNSLLPIKIFAQNTRPANVDYSGKPQLIRGPYLQVATDTSMVIRWRTDASTRSRVRYGTTPEKLGKVTDDVTLVTEHQMKLTGLLPRTKYYYAIGSLQDTLQYGANNYFVTLPSAGKEDVYRIGMFGDCGYLSVNQANVRDAFTKYLGKNDLDAWILLGDNAYNDGTDIEFQAKFFNIYKGDLLKKYPLFTCPGNHDYHDKDFTAEYAQNNHNTSYYQNFSMPVNGEAGGVPSHNPAFYSFDLGNIHFISLDSYGVEEKKYRIYDTAGPQVQWVKKDLAFNKNKGWVVAYWHHPPYSMGTHNSDTDGDMTLIRENLLQILENAGIDLIVCGHSHVYERSKLMKGYYGKEADFNEVKYNVSTSTGLYDGSKNAAPYVKDSLLNKGTVYVVSGSAAYVGIGEKSFPHAAMQYSNATNAGAVMLEVQGNRLDFKWICADGVIRDRFTMMKNVNTCKVVHLKKGDATVLSASFIGDYKWNNGETTRGISVAPGAGTHTYSVHDKYNCLLDTFKVIVSK